MANNMIDQSNSSGPSLKLRIGDIIFFKLEENAQGVGQGWLCGEGHLGDNVYLSSNPQDFHYGLWEIHIQNQYSSFNEYDESLQNQHSKDLENGGGEDVEDDCDRLFVGDAEASVVVTRNASERQNAEMLRQLKRAALNEQVLNEKAMQAKLGTPVVFGDVIQLRNVASRKFISVSTTQLAKQERENMRVLSIRNGNAFSAMVFTAKHLFNSNARTQVPNNCEIYVKVHERPGEYIRGARASSKSTKGEANCSLEKTSWVVNIYQPVSVIPTKFVTTGRQVSLIDRETLSQLVVVTPKSTEFLTTNAQDRADAEAVQSSRQNFASNSKVILRARRTDIIESGVNSLWRIEKKQVTRGGNIHLNSELVVYCHLNTNLYLHSRSSDGALIVVADRSRATEFDMSLSNLQAASAMGISIQEQQLEEGSQVHISTLSGFGSKIGLISTPLYVSGNVSKALASTALLTQPEIGAALTFKVNNTIQAQIGGDVYFGIETQRCLENFRVIASGLNPKHAIDSPNMLAASQAFSGLLQCLQQVVSWLYSKDMRIGVFENIFGSAPESLDILRTRQCMMREQGVLDGILYLLDECLSDKFNPIRASTGKNNNANIHKEISRQGGGKGSSGNILQENQNGGGSGGREAAMESSRKISLASKQSGGSTSAASPIKNMLGNAVGSLVRGVSMIFPGGSSNSIDNGYSNDSKKSKTVSPKALLSQTTASKGSDDEGSGNGNESDDSRESDSTQTSDDDDDDDFEKPWNTNGSSKSSGYGVIVASSDSKKEPGQGIKGELRTTITRRMSNMAIGKTVHTNSNISVSSTGELVLPPEMAGRTNGAERVTEGSSIYRQSKKLTASLELAEALLRALSLCIYNHPGNQLHVSEHMSILLKHVNTQEYAVYCLQELFKENQAILQTKIKQAEINTFMHLLSQSEMNVAFLRLLQSTCTCPKGVDGTQRMVAVALFGHIDKENNSSFSSRMSITDGSGSDSPGGSHKDHLSGLTIKMFSDPDIRNNKKCIWVHQGQYSYFPPSNSTEFDSMTTGVLGYKLLTQGLPETFVRWTTTNSSKSMERLFGLPDQVPFSLLTEAYHKEFSTLMRMKFVQNDAKAKKQAMEIARRASSVVSSYEKAKAQTDEKMKNLRATTVKVKRSLTSGSVNVKTVLSESDEYKSLVAEYMVTELYLVADLCLDRNYVAISILEKAFPYDMLLTVLRNNTVTSTFKAPICRILRCLWIDREPQTEAVFPRLIRSSKPTNEDMSGFTKHHKGSPYSFCLLQATIIDYFSQGLNRDKCDELSIEMTEITLMLMRFGFYSNEEHLRDVSVPLIRFLDTNAYSVGNEVHGHTRDIKNRRDSLWSVQDDTNTINEDDDGGLAMVQMETSSSQGDITGKRDSRRGSAEIARDFVTVIGSTVGSILPWVKRNSYAKITPQKKGGEYVNDDMSDDDSDNEHDAYGIHSKHAVYRTRRQMEAQSRKEAEMASNSHTWEAAYLTFTESVIGLAGVMLVVTLTVTVSVLQLFLDDIGDYTFRVFEVIDFSCSLFFLIELSMRVWCVARVMGVYNGAVIMYFTNLLNLIDLVLVMLDVILFFLGVDAGAGIGAARASKVVKIIRFVRLIRVIRVVRIVNALKDKANKTIEWALPSRFTKISQFQARTMTTALQALKIVADRIQDNSLEAIIRAFHDWCEVGKERALDDQDYMDADLEVIVMNLLSDSTVGGTTLIPPGFDRILADCIMYTDKDLCNEALTLLRKQLNKRSILMALATDIQIVYSPKVEVKLEEAKSVLQAMRTSAEMYEMWQDLEIEENYNKAEQLSTWIKTLSNMMRKINDDRTLGTKMEYIPDEEVQNLLRNLDALNCFMTILEALYDGGREELSEKIQKIMRSCVNMLCLFVENNSRNQILAFERIGFFIDTLDSDINSASAVHHILQGNAELVKGCHKRYVEEFAQLIFSHGQKPEYIRIFAAMTSGMNVSDSGMKSVQNNISRFLTSREWQTRILLWCCTPDSNAYAQRIYAMSQYPDEKMRPFALEDLSADLQYHILLLTVMSRCNLGPKLQAIYQLDDIVHAIIDKHTIFSVKIALVKCLEQLVCNGADLFVSSEYMWSFFDHLVVYISTLDREMAALFRRPISSHICLEKKNIGEWMETSLTIVTIFFSVLDMTIFGEIMDHDLAVKRTQRSEADVHLVIRKLYSSIRNFIERHNMLIGNAIQERGSYALVSLCRHGSGITYDFNLNSMGSRVVKARGSVTLADVQQLQLRHKFITFTEKLNTTGLHNHMVSVDFFLSLPTLDEKGTHDVRLEPLLTKIVGHIRENITSTETLRTLEGNYDESLWLLKTLRRLFENFLKQSVEYSIDVDLNRVSNNADTAFWRKTFNNCGVTELCMDFISVGIGQPLCLEAINLLIVMLAQRGGNSDAQMTIHKYLFESDTSLFFGQVKEILGELLVWYQKESDNISDSRSSHSEDVLILPDENCIFTLMQLMCEGNYLPLKNYMREQEGNVTQLCVPAYLASILDFLSRRESPLFTRVTVYVVKTIRMLLHGPCRENQRYFIINTDVLISLNRIIRLSRPKTQVLTSAWNNDIETLKECIIDVLRSSVEGFLRSSAVFDRLMSSIELNVLSVLLMPGEEDAHDVLEFGFTSIEAKYMVFLSCLEKKVYFDGLHSSSIVKCQECIRFVEVFWQGSTHRVYFKKPKILEDVSGDYLSKFDEIDGASQEDKLGGFLAMVKALHIEAKHQQLLKHYGLSYMWSRRYYLSWLMFVIGVVINVMLLKYYNRSKEDHTIHIGFEYDEETTVTTTLYGLTGVEILLSFVMSVLYMTVRMPANYLSCIENGHTQLEALMTTFSDPMPWWYIAFLTCASAGYIKDEIFCVVFMLEWIVLDDTTKNLLKAVYYPFWQLVATLTMLLIVINIFSALYFSLYPHDMEENHVIGIYDLWSSLRLALTYGLRGEYGVDHEFHTTLGSRMWLDLSFFFIVLAILRHIFFAIIVETFGRLREESNERLEKLHHTCFICGIGRHDFEKAGLSSNFHHHRDIIHSVENYVQFIFAILEQNEYEDVGIELHVRKCIKEMDISWIPIGLDSFYASVRQNRDIDEGIKPVDDQENEMNLTKTGIPIDDSNNDEHGNNNTDMGDNNSEHGGRGRGNNSSSNAGSNADVLRAVHALTNQMSSIAGRLDTIETLGSTLPNNSRNNFGSNIDSGGGYGKKSATQSRSQLRGPSEGLLRVANPSVFSQSEAGTSGIGIGSGAVPLRLVPLQQQTQSLQQNRKGEETKEHD